MANRWLATTLLDSIKRRGLIPTADETFAASDMYQLLDEEARGYILPLLREVHEEFLYVRHDEDLVAGQAEYPMPARCAAEALKAVFYDPNGTGLFGPPLQRLEPEHAYQSRTELTGAPVGYYLEDEAIILVPAPAAGATGTLRMVHFNRPNLPVASTAAAEVVSFNTTTKAITLRLADQTAGVPATFTSSETYDIIKGTPGFRSIAVDQAASVASNVLTFTEDLPDSLAAGDFVALAGQSPVVQLPAEMHPLLSQRVAFVILDAVSPRESAKAENTLEKMELKFRSMFENRTEAQPRYANNFNAVGWSRARLRGR